jgi:hypothetical protein
MHRIQFGLSSRKRQLLKGLHVRAANLRAWVYAIPEQPDARLFQSILSELDGRFHLQGLPPIPYLFFAADVEFNLDIHERKVLDYWRQRVPARALQAGSATKLDLQVSAIGN